MFRFWFMKATAEETVFFSSFSLSVATCFVRFEQSAHNIKTEECIDKLPPTSISTIDSIESLKYHFGINFIVHVFIFWMTLSGFSWKIAYIHVSYQYEKLSSWKWLLVSMVFSRWAHWMQTSNSGQCFNKHCEKKT